MKDSALEQMRQVLPELFDMNQKARTPGGMCTPGSGCPPAADGGGTDIVAMLTGAGILPPNPEQKAKRDEDAQAAPPRPPNPRKE